MNSATEVSDPGYSRVLSKTLLTCTSSRAYRANDGVTESGSAGRSGRTVRRTARLITAGMKRMYPNMIRTRSEKTSFSIVPLSSSTSRKAISATPLDMSPAASANGASIRVT